jgi:hypothetical protein
VPRLPARSPGRPSLLGSVICNDEKWYDTGMLPSLINLGRCLITPAGGIPVTKCPTLRDFATARAGAIYLGALFFGESGEQAATITQCARGRALGRDAAERADTWAMSCFAAGPRGRAPRPLRRPKRPKTALSARAVARGAHKPRSERQAGAAGSLGTACHAGGRLGGRGGHVLSRLRLQITILRGADQRRWRWRRWRLRARARGDTNMSSSAELMVHPRRTAEACRADVVVGDGVLGRAVVDSSRLAAACVDVIFIRER